MTDLGLRGDRLGLRGDRLGFWFSLGSMTSDFGVSGRKKETKSVTAKPLPDRGRRTGKSVAVMLITCWKIFSLSA